MTETLTKYVNYLATLTPTDPLAAAKAELDKANADFEAAKADFEAKSKVASDTVAALIAKANESNRKAAEAAQSALAKARTAYEAAREAGTKATATVHALEKSGAKAVNVTGADKVQLACGLACLAGETYDQEELIKVAVELTSKNTIGQYGYFRRLTKLFKLYGIEVSYKLPETETTETENN